MTAAYTSVPVTEKVPTDTSETKLDWKAQKEAQAKERKRQNDLKKTEERIAELETKIEEIEELMTHEDVYTNSMKCRELSEEKESLELELNDLYEKWEELLAG